MTILSREVRLLTSEGSDSLTKDTYDKLSHKLAIQKHEKYLKEYLKAWELIKLSVEPTIREEADNYQTLKEFYDWIVEYFQPKNAIFQQLLFIEFDRLNLAQYIDIQNFILKIKTTT